MKTKNDVLAEIEKNENDRTLSLKEFDAKLESQKIELFKAYDQDATLTAFLGRVEDCTDPDGYQFDQTGMLVSLYNLNFEAAAFPYLEDYITSKTIGYYEESEARVEVCHGEVITINWNHDRNSYFVYNGEFRKPIISKRIEGGSKITEEDYVRAKIEQHMRASGVFGDVVEVSNYDGSYIKHFSMRFPWSDTENLEDITDEKLQSLVDQYENNEEEN